MIVLDASVVAPWILPDEQDPVSVAAYVRMQQEGAYVPELWKYEIYSLLVNSERRRRITEDYTEDSLKDLREHTILCDAEMDFDETLRLARRHSLTFYDAAYLEIAVRRKIPLATLDRELAVAAKQAGVELLTA